MDATRFDTIARLFARRRRAEGAHGHQAQDRDVAPPDAAQGPTMLFLQAFKAGAVAPKAGAEDRYVLTLEQGLGHTVYFSDRPHREVGATSTPAFLAGLGFPEDNPPNAALVVEGAGGETEIAVLALYAPEYDESARTATYEVEALQGWQRSVQEGFVEASADLAQRLPSFGAAHLFIDGCPYTAIGCSNSPYVSSSYWPGWIQPWEFGGLCWIATEARCLPCQPENKTPAEVVAHWENECNTRFISCSGHCEIKVPIS